MLPRAFKALALSAALALPAGGAVAQQTAPNTVVTNTIDLTYNSGTGTASVTQNNAASITFNVDRKVDVIVTAQTGAAIFNAVPGQNVTLSYLVRNEGNDTQGFVVSVADGGNIGVAGGLAYSETATTTEGAYYVLISSDGTVGNGSVYNVNTGPNAGDLNAGQEYYVLIVANVPIEAVDGQLDDFIVTATATDAGTTNTVVEDRSQGLTGVNTVFADAASSSTRTSSEIDPATDGKAADETRILITAPIIVAEKTVIVLDENLPGSTFDCTAGGAATGSPLAAIPGACVEYTISVRNDSSEGGGTAAGSIEITDAIPANTTYAGHTANNFTIAENGSPVTSITAALANLPAGSTETFTIRVTID